jgi:hypothetical protein
VGKSFQEGSASSARAETAEKEKRRLRSSNIVFMDTGLSQMNLKEDLSFAAWDRQHCSVSGAG